MLRRPDFFSLLTLGALAALVLWLVFLLARIPMIGMALGADTATAVVTVPLTYHWADGTPLVPNTDYRYTTVSYGECSGDEEILKTVMGGTTIPAKKDQGLIFYVPVGVPLCAVAVVFDMDRLPLGKSNVAEFIIPTGIKPGTPVNLQLRF